MSWVFEDPTKLLVAIGLTIALAIMLLFTTGPGWLWKPALGLLLLAVVVIVVEQLVVTDREEIDQIISRGAEAFRRNDLATVESLLDPGARQLRRDVRTAMTQGRMQELHITHQEVRLDLKHRPPSAEVDVIVRGQASERNGPIEDFVIALTITLEKSSDAWVIMQARVEDLPTMLKGHKRGQ